MKIARAKTGVKKTQSLLRTSHILNVACLTARVKGFLRLLWGLLRVPFVCTKGGFVLYMAGVCPVHGLGLAGGRGLSIYCFIGLWAIILF